VIGRQGFAKDSYRHEEVFDDLKEPFTVKESGRVSWSGGDYGHTPGREV
jgi:hypothetical protein